MIFYIITGFFFFLDKKNSATETFRNISNILPTPNFWMVECIY